MHKSGLKVKILLFIGILIAIIALIYLGKNLFTILMDYHTSDVEYDNLVDNFVKQPEISKSIEKIEEINKEKYVEYRVTVNSNDMGKVIGKQGRVAKSIRTVMKSLGLKEDKKVNVEFVD